MTFPESSFQAKETPAVVVIPRLVAGAAVSSQAVSTRETEGGLIADDSQAVVAEDALSFAEPEVGSAPQPALTSEIAGGSFLAGSPQAVEGAAAGALYAFAEVDSLPHPVLTVEAAGLPEEAVSSPHPLLTGAAAGTVEIVSSSHPILLTEATGASSPQAVLLEAAGAAV